MDGQLELVFVASPKLDEVPFTTSDIIADRTGNSYRSIQRIIDKQKNRLEKFGILRFQIAKIGGRGRPHKVYQLNEPQATLLITFLKNTDLVADFKVELVRQFYIMRAMLQRQAIARENRKPLRRSMTDAIRDCIPDSPHKGMMYKHYSDLAYKSALGKNAKQLREERGAPKDANVAEYLTPDENEAVSKAENQIAVLLELKQDYKAVKAMMLTHHSLESA